MRELAREGDLVTGAGALRLLDLYSGAGGAARGYQQAGFHVTGIDHHPQPRYAGDVFIQADALQFVREHGHEYDAIHASPPCQFASIMHNLPWLKDKKYPALIAPTRELLIAIGRPYIIENVAGARNGSRMLAKQGLAHHGLKAGYLCGSMFGLPFYRHRYFETSWFWLQPGHPRHQIVLKGGRLIGNRQREANGYMDIDWMRRDELTQAIPPAYTEWLGRQLMAVLLVEAHR